MIIQIINGTLRLEPENAAEHHQLRAVVQRAENNDFGMTRNYDGSLVSVVFKPKCSDELLESEKNDMYAASKKRQSDPAS